MNNSIPSLVTFRDFPFEVTLRYRGSQFVIADGSTVSARIISEEGGKALTDWVNYSKNNGARSNWSLSILSETFPSSETSKLSSSLKRALLEVRVTGVDVDREGNSLDAYDRPYTFDIAVRDGAPDA